jgi:hypothetical protein
VQLDRSRRQLRWDAPAAEHAAALAAARPASPEVRDALRFLAGQARELSSENGVLRCQLESVTRALSPVRGRGAGGEGGGSPGRAGAGRLAWAALGGREQGGQRKGWSPGGSADSREAKPLQYAPKMSCAYGL